MWSEKHYVVFPQEEAHAIILKYLPSFLVSHCLKKPSFDVRAVTVILRERTGGKIVISTTDCPCVLSYCQKILSLLGEEKKSLIQKISLTAHSYQTILTTDIKRISS